MQRSARRCHPKSSARKGRRPTSKGSSTVNIEIVLSEPDDETTYEPELVDGEWMGEFSAPCAVVILLVFVLVIAVTC